MDLQVAVSRVLPGIAQRPVSRRPQSRTATSTPNLAVQHSACVGEGLPLKINPVCAMVLSTRCLFSAIESAELRALTDVAVPKI